MNLPARIFSVVACFALFNMSVPFGAVAVVGIPLRQKAETYLKLKEVETKKHVVSHLMTRAEQKNIYGRTGQCPYIAGQNKWDVMYKNINLVSGNYAMSATDLSFDGAYGIPCNVTRSYSANDANEGPFGPGWELSADVRNTAGGILKSPAAPVRSIPNTLKERHSQESDPNIATQPAAAVTATDAGGKEETLQKDVDGVLTTPPWDTNLNTPSYQFKVFQGATYQIENGCVTTTVDGTVYTYQAEGSYVNGTLPYNAAQMSPAPTPQPANVLKLISVQDRQGNLTTYSYDTNPSHVVTFNKIDGQTQECPLSSVTMASNQTLHFYWNYSTSRVTSVSDGTRTVQYGYDSNNNLNKVTDPAGLITYYTYGSANAPQGWNGDTATNLLVAMQNPQGLTTNIAYTMQDVIVAPYEESPGEGVVVSSVTAPNGVMTYATFTAGGASNSLTYLSEYSSSTILNQGTLQVSQLSNNGTTYLDVLMEIPGVTDTDDLRPRFTPYWEKMYDPNSQNLMTEIDTSFAPNGYGTAQDQARRLEGYSPASSWTVTTNTVYNFAGNPLQKTVTEHTNAASGYTAPPDVTYTTGYAYWGALEYFQQMATQSDTSLSGETVNYTYTDYYPSTAAAGLRGQKYHVYDPKYGGVTASGSNWRYNVAASGIYSAMYGYDSNGRCTSVSKLQSVSSGVGSYVLTATTYGGVSNSYGAATQIVEDFGSGNINRTTKNTAFTGWGKATTTIDSAGHQFVTAFDNDGKVQSITRTDSGLNQSIVTNTYGSSGVSNGLPTSVKDGLSGVIDSIYYDPTATDGGYGQVSSTSETNGSATSSCAYTYSSAGDRATATYATPSGTQKWGYLDYVRVGSPESGKRAFQTLNKLSSGGATTSEEMHYAYDSSGALYCAAFAQTPQSGQTGYSSDPAQSRCRVFYNRDPRGRQLSATHWWDTWNGSGYNSEAVIDNECAYELNTGENRGVKLTSDFYKNTAEGSSAWTSDHDESYSYDPQLGFLTGANYGDGLPNANPSWSYDPAANRSDTVADHLNRPTSIGGVACTSDILGNRLTFGSQSYGWDCLSRMSNYGANNSYIYRVDGMRVSKMAGTTSTSYFYDGQMGVEDVDTTSGASTITDYGLGARGIDYIAANKSGTTTVGFPLYDCHGNMTACLFRSGNNYYSTGNLRHYDAWGAIRSGSASGDPKGRYCASIGHKQDDESGLIYMRARYLDITSGRFVSQDLQMQGSNWYAYCRDDPVNAVDHTGDAWDPCAEWGLAFGFAFSCAAVIAYSTVGNAWNLAVVSALITCAAASVQYGLNYTDVGPDRAFNGTMLGLTIAGALLGVATSIAAGLCAAKYAGLATSAVFATAAYSTILLGFLMDCMGEGLANNHDEGS